MAEGIRQLADAPETADDELGWSHAGNVRYVRTSVNVECVRNVRLCVRMGTIGERFRELCDRSGLKGDALAKELGYSRRSSLQRLTASHYDTPFRPAVAERYAKGLVGRGSPPIKFEEVMALADTGTKSSLLAGPVLPNEQLLSALLQGLLDPPTLPAPIDDSTARVLARALPHALRLLAMLPSTHANQDEIRALGRGAVSLPPPPMT